MTFFSALAILIFHQVQRNAYKIYFFLQEKKNPIKTTQNESPHM